MNIPDILRDLKETKASLLRAQTEIADALYVIENIEIQTRLMTMVVEHLEVKYGQN